MTSVVLAHRVEHRPEVAVAENAPLRGPRRAGGVDERVGVLGADLRRAPRELALVSATPARGELLEAEHARDGLDRDRAAQRRRLQRAHLLQLLAVLADDHRGFGVAQHPLALLRRVRRIDRHHDAAHGGHRQIGVSPLGARPREDRDALTGVDAELDQTERDIPDDLRHLDVADLPPALRGPAAHRDALTVALGRLRQQLGDALGRCDCAGHGSLRVRFRGPDEHAPAAAIAQRGGHWSSSQCWHGCAAEPSLGGFAHARDCRDRG